MNNNSSLNRDRTRQNSLNAMGLMQPPFFEMAISRVSRRSPLGRRPRFFGRLSGSSRDPSRCQAIVTMALPQIKLGLGWHSILLAPKEIELSKLTRWARTWQPLERSAFRAKRVAAVESSQRLSEPTCSQCGPGGAPSSPRR